MIRRGQRVLYHLHGIFSMKFYVRSVFSRLAENDGESRQPKQLQSIKGPKRGCCIEVRHACPSKVYTLTRRDKQRPRHL